MKRLFLSWLSASILLAGPLSMRAEPVALSSLDLSKMSVGWGTPKANRAITGKPLSIGGKKFAQGVGSHASSSLRLELNGQAKRFRAQVGIDDSAGGLGSVEFFVLADGRTLFKSGLRTGGQPPLAVDVDLSGVHILSLRVGDGGDGTKSDRADWAEAELVMAEGAAKPSVLPPYESIGLKTAHFELGFLVGEDGRLYQQAIGGSGADSKLERNLEAYPQAGDGYVWEPALQVVHADGNTSTTLLFEGVSRTNEAAGRQVVRLQLRDPAYPLQVTLCFRLHEERDVIEQWSEIRHSESGDITLERMASSSLLLTPTNVYLTHFFGDWAAEMKSTTELLTPGTKVLDSKLGARAHRFANPSFILSLDGAPSENSGRLLAGTLAWSGNFQLAFDHHVHGVHALCGINPFASAYHLKAGQTFTTPTMIWTWSEQGLGPMSRKLHAWARDFGLRDGHEPRAVLLNNWEATGFDFDFARIAGLFGPARELGTELFLLDDGWFGNKYPRVNDRAGLGDWEPNRKRLPQGLAPLAQAAIKEGVRFGIWIEPEMVNPKSELFEQHPDWVIRQPKRELELQRQQLVLDLARPEVQAFEWSVIDGALKVPGISYAKWDCNRYLTQPGSSWLAPERQTHLFIDYVQALYGLMERTAKTYPKTELMLCSGGGGRVDYGALRFFHEFWPSDNTDPVSRVPMQWNYSYFFPSMAVASHVTHWGNRPMHFSCSVAMSARFGMDLDLTKLTAQDKAICAGAIAAYKQVRDVVSFGDLYRLEDPQQGARGTLNYVSADGARAVVFAFQLKDGTNAPVHPQGLVPTKRYTLHQLNPAPGQASAPQEGQSLSGEQWMGQGIVPACSKALEACVLELGS